MGYFEKEIPEEEQKKDGTLKPLFTPPVFIKQIQSYYRCKEDGFFAGIFGCETKARYCESNCRCDEVCKDTSCSAHCVPNCRCYSYCSDCYDCHDCSDCDDRGCYHHRPECWGYCLNDWE